MHGGDPTSTPIPTHPCEDGLRMGAHKGAVGVKRQEPERQERQERPAQTSKAMLYKKFPALQRSR